MDFDLVWKVFNKDFSVKNCGREVCESLIEHLENLYPDVDFGDSKTGFIKVGNAKKVILEELSTKCD